MVVDSYGPYDAALRNRFDTTTQKRHLTLRQKIEIVQFIDERPKTSIRKITRELSAIMNRPLDNSTVARIIRNREDLLNMRDVDPNRVRIIKNKPVSAENPDT